MFADFRRFLQICFQNLANLANFGKIFGFIFPARWAIFRILTQNLEKSRSGRRFRAPGVFFFRFLAFFSSIWPNFRLENGISGVFFALFVFRRG